MVQALSTAINAVAYDPRARILEVQYAGGQGLVYRYRGVPPDVFGRFTHAWALGSFLNQFIKPVYPFERLTLEEAARRPLSDVTRAWHGPLMGGFTRRKRALRGARRPGRARTSRPGRPRGLGAARSEAGPARTAFPAARSRQSP